MHDIQDFGLDPVRNHHELIEGQGSKIHGTFVSVSEDNLKGTPDKSLAPNQELPVADVARKRVGRITDDFFRLCACDAVRGDVFNVPVIPTEYHLSIIPRAGVTSPSRFDWPVDPISPPYGTSRTRCPSPWAYSRSSAAAGNGSFSKPTRRASALDAAGPLDSFTAASAFVAAPTAPARSPVWNNASASVSR